MTYYAQYHQHWLEQDGKRVEIDGYSYIIKVRTMWNYDRTSELIDVSAEPTLPTKRTAYYQDEKRRLGDDWSIDVLSMDVEKEVELLNSLDPNWSVKKPGETWLGGRNG